MLNAYKTVKLRMICNTNLWIVLCVIGHCAKVFILNPLMFRHVGYCVNIQTPLMML